MSKNWEFYIAGVKHHQLYEVIDKIEENTNLLLTLEPSNPYDSNAVRIEFPLNKSYKMLGYVPATMSKEVSEAITRSENQVSCVVTRLAKDEKPWKQCRVLIREENKDE